MKILTKEGKGFKDYYDYIVSIMGMDELVVYDRRNAFPIDPTKKWGDDSNRTYPCRCSDYQNINVEKWFRKEVLCSDKKRSDIRRYSSKKVLTFEDTKEQHGGDSHKQRLKNNSWDIIKEGEVLHFVLEVGFHHYIFEVERYIDDENDNVLHLNYGLVESHRIEKDEKISKQPMCLSPIKYMKYHLSGESKFCVTKEEKDNVIENPILYSTYIPKFISPYDVWNLLYEYISSLRDKEFVDSRTNDQHIESHGFDKKISFRHRKNKQ